MFKHKSTSGSNCFVTFILPEGALFVYQLFAEQSIILNLKQKRNPVSTKFLFCYLTEFCPSLTKVKFYTLASLANKLIEANQNGSLPRLIKQIEKLDLLILDELGYIPL